MKCVIQRVKYARVFIDEKQVGKIEKGALLLLGIEKNDGENDISKLLKKILELRIFSNDKGQFDYSLLDIKGDLMVVSQFTLMANCAKGVAQTLNLQHSQALQNHWWINSFRPQRRPPSNMWLRVSLEQICRLS